MAKKKKPLKNKLLELTNAVSKVKKKKHWMGLTTGQNINQTGYQNVKDAIDAVIRRQFIALNVCIRKEERFKELENYNKVNTK